MGDQVVRMIVKLNIKAGNLELFKSLARDLKETVEASEPDTIGYEWFMDASEQTSYLVETYPNSEVLLKHLDNVGEKLGPLLDAAPLGELLVFGALTSQAAEVLAGLGAKVFPPYIGFLR